MLETLLAAALAALAAHFARHLIKAIWERIAEVDEPDNPIRGDEPWGRALVFGIVASGLAGIFRVVLKGAVSSGYRRLRTR